MGLLDKSEEGAGIILIRMKRVMGLYDKNERVMWLLDRNQEGGGIIW